MPNTYYINPSASYNGDGSLAHPFNSWADFTIQAGDTYLQEAGTVYRGTIDINNLGANPADTVIGSYGMGAAPQINLFSGVTSWKLVSGTIYSSDIGWDGGEVEQDGQPLTFVPWNGSVQSTLSTSADGVYTFDPDLQTIFLRTNNGSSPSSHNIQVAHGDFGITMSNSSNVTVSGLEITGASRHGVHVSGGQNIVLTDMNIHNVGGQWDASNQAYLGNGVEFADGSSNDTVEDSRIWDVFDSGVTAQLYSPAKLNAHGFVFSGNQIYDCGFAGVELASIAPNTTVSGVTIANNAIYDDGLGWSGNRGGKGNGVYGWTASGSNGAIKNVTLSGNNICSNTGNGVDFDQAHGNLTLNNNTIDNNQQNGVFLADYLTGNGDIYSLDNNDIFSNAGSGVWLNNWGGSGFSFIKDLVADNGIDGAGNFVTDGFGSGINILYNAFINHYGPAATAMYNYWAGGNVDHNTYTGLASAVLSAGGQVYGLSQVSAYQALTGQDVHSLFYAG